ncbi:hypothetical protein [Mucilaginibacter sp.]
MSAFCVYTLAIPGGLTRLFVRLEHQVIVVPGPSKSQAVYNTLNKTVDESHPSTILTTHPDAVLYLDKDSSNLL